MRRGGRGKKIPNGWKRVNNGNSLWSEDPVLNCIWVRGHRVSNPDPQFLSFAKWAVMSTLKTAECKGDGVHGAQEEGWGEQFRHQFGERAREVTTFTVVFSP